MTLLNCFEYPDKWINKNKQIAIPPDILTQDISIIIPVKNNQLGLNNLLMELSNSISRNRYQPEVIIVDNLSEIPIGIPPECLLFSNFSS